LRWELSLRKAGTSSGWTHCGKYIQSAWVCDCFYLCDIVLRFIFQEWRQNMLISAVCRVGKTKYLWS